MLHADDAATVQRALLDVRAVICPGKVGVLLAAAVAQRVPHLVLLASAGRQWGTLLVASKGIAYHDHVYLNWQ